MVGADDHQETTRFCGPAPPLSCITTAPVTMSDTTHPAMPQADPSPQLASAAMIRQSVEMSPSRVSIRSSSSQSQATPSSSVSNTPLLPTRPSSPGKRPPHPADSNSFLTALATQERRVLELREELNKANEELEKLKSQWAVQEATKKKHELRHLQQLQPLNTPLGLVIPSDYDSLRASRDPDRRRITGSGIKPSHRKIFAGSRHTQALSLLSPKDSDLLVRESEFSNLRQTATNDVAVPANVPELSSMDAESGSDDSYRDPQKDQKDVILETGKQLVGDFRQGLWTFFEDFKQLTVGDEGISTAGLRNPSVIAPGNVSRPPSTKEEKNALHGSPARKTGVSKAVREPSRKPRNQVPAPVQRIGRPLETPTETVGPISNSTYGSEGWSNANASDSDDDGWDNWDKGSTPPRNIIHGAHATTPPLKDRSSQRTSTR